MRQLVTRAGARAPAPGPAPAQIATARAACALMFDRARRALVKLARDPNPDVQAEAVRLYGVLAAQVAAVAVEAEAELVEARRGVRARTVRQARRLARVLGPPAEQPFGHQEVNRP